METSLPSDYDMRNGNEKKKQQGLFPNSFGFQDGFRGILHERREERKISNFVVSFSLCLMPDTL